VEKASRLQHIGKLARQAIRWISMLEMLAGAVIGCKRTMKHPTDVRDQYIQVKRKQLGLYT